MNALLQEIEHFEMRNQVLNARSPDEVIDWISEGRGGYTTTILDRPENGTVARFARKNIGDVSLVTYRWAMSHRASTLGAKDRLFVALPLSGRVKMEHHEFGLIEPKSSQARIYERTAGRTTTIESGYANLSLTFPINAIRESIKNLYGSDIDDELKFEPLLDLDKESAQPFMSFASYLVAQSAFDTDVYDSPLLKASFTDYCNSTLLNTLPHNLKRFETLTFREAVPRYVQLAEEFMRSFADQAITIDQIARHAGCSQRALQKSFGDFRQTTPMSTLRDIRLECASNDIINGAGTITDIAFKWGFSNLGRFSKLYYEKFGEKPSEVRRLA